MREQKYTVSIETLNRDGKGEGAFEDLLHQQKVAEVPFSIPGDVVEAYLKRKRSGIFPGRLLTVLSESQDAVKQRCLHFGSCGGCTFQRLPYPLQLKWKEEKVLHLFSQLLSPDVERRAIIGLENPWGYRNKMEFSFSQDSKGEKFLGMMLAGSRGKVFHLTECHLVSTWFSETVVKVRSWWNQSCVTAYNPPKNRGSLRTLTLRESATQGEKLVMLTVSGNPEDALGKSDLDAFRALFPEDVSLYLRIQQAIKGHPTQFFEMHLGGPESICETLRISLGEEKTSEVRFAISPSAFFQPNTRQAERLYSEALRLAALREEMVVYDLYCGTGTLGCLAARFVSKVVGIELSPESSLDARENAKLNGFSNVEIITGDVGKELSGRFSESPDLVLLDPPRSGLDSTAIEQVVRLKPKKIVYISCNPETQARDVAQFLQAGFKLNALQPVDQFPQTPHIENIALLTFP